MIADIVVVTEMNRTADSVANPPSSWFWFDFDTSVLASALLFSSYPFVYLIFSYKNQEDFAFFQDKEGSGNICI